MKDSIELTEMNRNYTGGFSRLEVLTFSPDIHDEPGLYLQHVEGCGYMPYTMTPEQAIELGNILIRSAKQTQKLFKQKKA